jgi:hypothetical protein
MGWVDVTLELANQTFMIWKSKYELAKEFEAQLNGTL